MELLQVADTVAREKNIDRERRVSDDELPPIDFGRIAAQTAKQVIVQRSARPSASAVRGVQGPRRRDRQRHRQARRIRQRHRRPRPRRRRSCAATSDSRARASARRPRPRLHLRRPRGDPRPADLPVAHPSAVHGQAVRPGSAGDLRRHHRDQVGRPRPGQPRQDRRDLQRQLDRPGRRLRRHARQPRPGRGAELQGEKIDIIPGRRPRHLRRQRAGPGRGRQGRARRGKKRMEVVVPDEQLSLAIGRRGQNVRLASSSPAGTSTS
jgi:N utilization substance protein A